MTLTLVRNPELLPHYVHCFDKTVTDYRIEIDLLINRSPDGSFDLFVLSAHNCIFNLLYYVNHLILPTSRVKRLELALLVSPARFARLSAATAPKNCTSTLFPVARAREKWNSTSCFINASTFPFLIASFCLRPFSLSSARAASSALITARRTVAISMITLVSINSRTVEGKGESGLRVKIYPPKDCWY